MFRFAVIADAHFHDPETDFGVDGPRWSGLSLRPGAEVARVPRLFNETGAALTGALDDAARRGIRHVVLLGDLTDDGQGATAARLRVLLDRFTDRFGMRFHALPGNHDVFADAGRHRTRRFLTATGHIAVTSDPAHLDPDAERVHVSPGMHCGGYADFWSVFPEAGLRRDPRDLHWETPFGTAPAPGERRLDVASPDGSARIPVTDASHLAEPVEGIWFLMIDANVFVPRDRCDRCDRPPEPFADATDAGWTAMPAHKAAVLDWIADVARRAREAGKRLVAFSHYPLLDPRGGPGEERAIGRTALARRIPGPEVGRALARAGVRLHFGGHLHINALTRGRWGGDTLTDVAVPSLAAYPAAWKAVTLSAKGLTVETVRLGALPCDPLIRSAYAAEAARSGDRRLLPLAAAPTLDALALAHARVVVGRRHLRRDWPVALAGVARLGSLGDLVRRLPGPMPADLPPDGGWRDVPLLDFVTDWYLVRMAGPAARADLDPDRLAAVLRVAAHLRASPPRGGPEAAFAALLAAFAARLDAEDGVAAAPF